MAPETTVVLVHGGWHSPFVFREFIPLLEHKSATMQLPSVGIRAGQHRDLRDDTDAVRAVVVEALDRGENVVIVAHSYGSVPACEACPGLLLADRKAKGKENGIIGFVYVAAFVLHVGEPVFMPNNPRGSVDWLTIRDRIATIDDPHKIFYQQLSKEEAQPYLDALRPNSVMPWVVPTSFAAHEKTSTAYLFTTKDQTVPLSEQKYNVSRSQKPFDLTREIESQHVPFVGPAKGECAAFVNEAVHLFERIASSSSLPPSSEA